MADNENQAEKRTFEGPDGKEYHIDPPNAEDIRGADWQYSKTYTKCLVEGITTSAEMTDILTRRGIIGPEFEKRANELAENLNNKIIQLEATDDLDEKRQLSIDVANAREELYQWNQRLSGPMNNTCESISDDARLEYLTSCMVKKEDNSRVWDSYESFLTDRNNALPIKARFEVMLYLQGLESDFLDKTPEAQAMREVESEVMAKAEEALNAAEAAKAEEEAAELPAEEETPDEDEGGSSSSKSSSKSKPKTTRKRRTTSKKKSDKSSE